MPGRRSDAKSNGRPRMPMATLVRRASRAGIAGSVLLAAVLAAPPAARAGEAGAGLPTGVCMPGSCGTAQRRIWQRFERGGGLDPATAAIVHSGVCYVRDRLYDPDRAHHVGFLIDGSDGGPLLFLRFSFYAAANPFAGLDEAAARARLADGVLPVSLHDGHAYADYADAHFFARYWLRRDAATGRVLLVAYFGYRMTILCEAAASGS
jgi:hypothetical protein